MVGISTEDGDDSKDANATDSNSKISEHPPPTSESCQPIPYSIMSKSSKRWLTLLIGVASMFSPLSANIYLPCIPLLSRDLSTSIQNINLTVTTYVIFQGIAPVFFGELSDKLGRRPVYIITFTIYVCANIGLAVQNKYVALLLLRMLQSLGASATVAIGFGVVADVATAGERGSMIGLASVATNLGPLIGPLIGGPLADAAGWRWNFWLLTILGCSFLISLLLFLPETCRTIVGNGSTPAQRWNRPLKAIFRSRRAYEVRHHEMQPSESMSKRLRAIIPNPLKALKLLIEKETAIVLSVAAIFYTTYYILQASIATLLQKTYGINETQIGLCYLAIGAGVVVGGFSNGKLMDYNYRHTAKKIGFKTDKVAGDDLLNFPIELARSRFQFYWIVLHTVVLAAYGWVIQQEIHIAVPLIMQCFLGALGAFIVPSFNTLTVDMHPNGPSTAAAAGNITRCGLSAAGVAAMQPLMDVMGIGPFFSALAGLSCVLGVVVLVVLRRKGMSWRRQRAQKREVLDGRHHLTEKFDRQSRV